MLAGRADVPGRDAALTRAELTDAAGGPAALLARPRDAERAIRDRYRAKHYLVAEGRARPRRRKPAGWSGSIVPVKEGPAAMVGAVDYRGATLPERRPGRRCSRIEAGATYDRVADQRGLLRVRDHYLSKGYPAVRVVPRLEPEGADLRRGLRVVEGPRVAVGTVEINGLQRTRRVAGASGRSTSGRASRSIRASWRSSSGGSATSGSSRARW